MVHIHREDKLERISLERISLDRISFKGYPVWKALVLHILSLKKVKNRILNDIETEQGWYGQ